MGVHRAARRRQLDDLRRWPLRRADRGDRRSPDAGVGFGAGIERLLLALEDAGVTAEPPAPDVFLAVEPDAPRELALGWLKELRAAGVAADTDYAGRSLKGQLTQAGRSGAPTTVIVGAAEAIVRRQGAQDEQVAHADVLGKLLG